MKQTKIIRINIPPGDGRPKRTILVNTPDIENDRQDSIADHIEALAESQPSSIQEFFILLNERIKNHH